MHYYNNVPQVKEFDTIYKCFNNVSLFDFNLTFKKSVILLF